MSVGCCDPPGRIPRPPCELLGSFRDLVSRVPNPLACERNERRTRGPNGTEVTDGPTVGEASQRWAPVALAAMSDRTLVLLKPDAVERKLIGEIVGRFEAKNLSVAAMELRTLDDETLARHYEEHQGKPFYADLVAFMSRGPVVAMAVEGPEDTWEVVRGMMGATNPR